ncbi:2-oxoacid:acceptor oxidoreductase family protein [Desulfotruncus alcoholivorax]|uniref:2-oxoacid:acceptor oxidoreductase family protein n=1 Tax=Desulfotruncus alcoholivorax TaxID=265477 RepID=UPI0004218FD9|nr:2-oxoacid:acceptor oxidoreductase family protein [Desulfotruncus alcoholivorax]
MKERYEIILAGSGGQGLIVCGMMLGEAAILEGKNVVQTQSYGIASRGGFSKAEVIIDRDEIIFQQVQKPDLVLALTEEAMEIYASGSPEIPVFYDTTLLKTRSGENLYGFPFTEMARELGHTGTANMIALGVMSAVTGLVKMESLAAVINKRFSGKVAEMNIKALNLGLALAAK